MWISKLTFESNTGGISRYLRLGNHIFSFVVGESKEKEYNKESNWGAYSIFKLSGNTPLKVLALSKYSACNEGQSPNR